MMKKLLTWLLASLLLAMPAQAVTVQLPGQGIYLPYIPNDAGPAPWANTSQSAIINSNSTQFAVIGRIYQKDTAFQAGGTKTISSISWATGPKTCAACTDQLTVTAETVGTTGPPAAPSGTILASGGATVTTALTAVTGSGMDTETFGTGPVVNFGDLVAFRFAISSHTTGAIAMAAVGQLYSCGIGMQFNTSANSGSTWTRLCQVPGVLQINFSDGTTGTIGGSYVYNSWNGPNADSYNSSSAFNETGIDIEFPIGVQVDGLCGGVAVAGTTSTFTMELTDNTAGTPTVLASYSPSPFQTRATGGGAGSFNQAASCFGVAPVTLTANTLYHLGALATGAGNITTTNYVVGTAAGFDTAFGCGQLCVYRTRKNSTWSSTTATKRPYLFVRVSAFNIGTGPTKNSLLNRAIP